MIDICHQCFDGESQVTIVVATRYYDEDLFEQFDSRVEVIYLFTANFNQMSTRSLKLEQKNDWEPFVLDKIGGLNSKDILILGQGTLDSDDGIKGYLELSNNCSMVIIKRQPQNL